MILTGFKKKVAQMKTSGEIPVQEGKAELKSEAYEIVAKELIKEHPSSGESVAVGGGKKHRSHVLSWALITMGWLFYILSWNLLARSCTSDEIMFSHLMWQMDHLLVFIGKNKSDQQGTNGAYR